jgi:hypothetical protein
MGVADWIAGVGTKRVHVLVIETPGASLLRMRVQAAIAARGWVEATSPADADALLVCGDPVSPLSDLIDAVWEQIPSPRHRATATQPSTIAKFLDAIPVALRDQRSQRADAHDRLRHVSMLPAEGMAETTSVDTSDMPGMHYSEAETEPPVPEESGHDDPMHENSMHENSMHENSGSNPAMDMGMDMDMSGPAGIPLAEGGQDRDGLEMDVTHLTIGPILPAWPADLVLHCTLHGDVVADVRVERLPSGVPPTEQPAVAAQLCDAAARLLSVVGWDPVARQADRLRNDIVSGVAPHDVSRRLILLTARIRRSRTLRWSLAGIHSTGSEPARERLLTWLQAAQEFLTAEEGRPFHIPAGKPAASEADIKRAVLGRELSTVRLIVASLSTGAGTSPRVVLGHE